MLGHVRSIVSCFLPFVLFAQAPGFARTLLHVPFDGDLKVLPEACAPAVVSSAVRYRPGVRGKALVLAGDAAEMRVPCEGLDGMGAWTLELWVLPHGWTGSDPGTPFVLRLSSGDSWSATIAKDASRSNLVIDVLTDKGGQSLFAPIYSWRSGRWVQLMFVVRSRRSSFYVNGEAAAPLGRKRSIPARPAGKPGLALDASRPLAVDEIRVYDRALLPADIAKRFVTARVGEKQYEVPLVRIPPAPTPPARTGEINPAAWGDAARVTGFSQTLTAKGECRAPRQTWVHLTYDRDHLYVLYQSRIPEEGLSGAPRERDVASGGGDEVEFFVMPGYTETFDYFQFLGNPRESQYDSLGLHNRAWNGKWMFRCSTAGPWWWAELWVDDWGPLGTARPQPGDCWRMNFCRNWWRVGGGHLWTLWSQTSGGYHNHSRFGRIVFGTKEDPFVRVDALARRTEEGRRVAAELEVVNPGPSAKTLTASYVHYAIGEYVPSSTVERTVELAPKARRTLRLENDVRQNAPGLVELTVTDCTREERCFYQMLKLGGVAGR